jgi:glycosyltransferase involved in cell wall biosynthesis
MRVLISSVASSAAMSGITRHTINLVQSLLSRPEVDVVTVVVANWQYKNLCEALPAQHARLRILQIHIRRGSLRRNLWYYLGLPKIAKQQRADIVHYAYPAPLNAKAFRCPVVVTLHDLYPYDIPENFGFPKVVVNRSILKQCLGASSAIACVSKFTRKRLAILLPDIPLQKATTIYNSVEIYPPSKWLQAEDVLDSQPFILMIAQHRRNKNVILAMQVFERLLRESRLMAETQLIIVGIEGPETKAIQHFIKDACLTYNVKLEQGISDRKLHWYYRHCKLLFVPSTIEGFGLPVAEGLLAGCRIVCSDIPAFREFGTTDCHFVPLRPSANSDFGQAIINALQQPKSQPLSLPQLSAALISLQYLNLYNALAAATKPQAYALTTEELGSSRV